MPKHKDGSVSIEWKTSLYKDQPADTPHFPDQIIGAIDDRTFFVIEHHMAEAMTPSPRFGLRPYSLRLELDLWNGVCFSIEIDKSKSVQETQQTAARFLRRLGVKVRK